MEQKISPKKTIVLKPRPVDEVKEVVEKKKTSLFGTVFSRPKPEDISILSVDLFYEPYWIVGGQYAIDYFRKNVYEFAADSGVKEVNIGKGRFPVRTETGTWKKIRDSIKVGEKENKIDIPVEEHVELDVEDEIVFNCQGKEIKFNYKIESQTVENFPDDTLKNNQSNVRPSALTEEQVVQTLIKNLREDMDDKIRIENEKIIIDRLEEVYVPIYEARCADSKNKVQVLRIDGMNLKIL